MRWAAALAAMVLFSLAGSSCAYSIKRRERILRDFCADIETLLREIERRPRNIEDVALSLKAGHHGAYWADLALRLGSSQSAEEAWLEAARHYRGFDGLKEEEMKLILSAGEGLGQSSLKAQIEAVHRTGEEVRRRAEELKQEGQLKGTLYTRLGILGGIGAALLMI